MLGEQLVFLALLVREVSRDLFSFVGAVLAGIPERWQALRPGVLSAQLVFSPCWFAKLVWVSFPSSAQTRYFYLLKGRSAVQKAELFCI